MNRPREHSTRPLRTRTLLALLAYGALVFAIAQGAPTDRAVALFGSNEWVVVDLQGPDGPIQLLPGGVAVFELTDIGNLAGTAGCNRLGAMITFGEGISIEFGRVIATAFADGRCGRSALTSHRLPADIAHPDPPAVKSPPEATQAHSPHSHPKCGKKIRP